MADASSTFTVRGTADVDDALRGINRVDKESESLGQQFRTMAGSIITAEAAMQLFSVATQFASESVSKAIDANEKLKTASDQVTGSVNSFQLSLGNLIIGGENGAIAMYNLADILLDLSDAIAASGTESNIATIAVESLREIIIGITYVLDGAKVVWEAFKLTITSIVSVLYAAGQGISGLSNALADLAIIGVGTVIEGFASLLESSVSVARALGAGGLLPESIDETIASIRNFGSSIQEGLDPVARLQQTGVEISGTFSVFGREVSQSAGRITEFVGFNENLRNSLRSTRTEIDLASDSTRGFGQAVETAMETSWDFSEAESLEALAPDPGSIIDPKELEALRRGKENEILERIRLEEQAARESELLALQEFQQRRMDLIFGGGDFDSLSSELQVKISEMSENSAASLGVLNSAMLELSDGFATSLTSAITSGERIDRALKKALSGMLTSLGSTYIAQGTALMIPPPYNPLGNPAAGKVMLGVGTGMLALGMAFGGGGGKGAKGGGGGGGEEPPSRSVGESSGIMPVQGNRSQGPMNLIDYTGVTIVTNDTDSMRTLINQTSRTEQLGGNSRV